MRLLIRSNLISDHYQFPLFDKVFQVFWLFLKELKDGDDADQSQQGLEEKIANECLADERVAGQSDEDDDQLESRKICLYSPVENFASKDFSDFTESNLTLS